jgi:hypothetical protein
MSAIYVQIAGCNASSTVIPCCYGSLGLTACLRVRLQRLGISQESQGVHHPWPPSPHPRLHWHHHEATRDKASYSSQHINLWGDAQARGREDVVRNVVLLDVLVHSLEVKRTELAMSALETVRYWEVGLRWLPVCEDREMLLLP